MDYADVSRSGYYPSDSTMDGNTGHTVNDTSVLTSLGKDPHGGSESFEHLENSIAGSGNETCQATDQDDAMQYEVQMYLATQSFSEWRSNEPSDVHACQLDHSQRSMSICDIQLEAGLSDVNQNNAEQLEPQHNDAYMHYTQYLRLPYLVDTHLPMFAVHDELYSSHITPQHDGPSALEGHYPGASGLGQGIATNGKSQASRRDELKEELGQRYPSCLHERRNVASFVPQQPILGDRDAPWSMVNPHGDRHMDLTLQVKNLVDVISTLEVKRTSEDDGKIYGSAISKMDSAQCQEMPEEARVSGYTVRPIDTSRFRSTGYSDNSGLRSYCGDHGEFPSPLGPAEAQQSVMLFSFQSRDGYDMTYPNHLEIPASEAPIFEPSSLVGSAPSDVLHCPLCPAEFRGAYRRGNLGRHRRHKHNGMKKKWFCEDKRCSKSFQRADARLKHYRSHHPELAGCGRESEVLDRRRLC